MSFLKKIFSQKKSPIITTNEEFWQWFAASEKDFFEVVKQRGDIENLFFNKLSPKLNELKDGYFYLTGMFDNNTVELILTADGKIENIVFVEELVKSAPIINGWKFTALKPPLDIKNVEIKMAGYKFSGDNISFYSNHHSKYPDEIDVTFVHDDLNEENKSEINIGTGIFLDNFLGELNFSTTIDMMNFVAKKDVKQELIPVEKLKDFLTWRQTEFIEKYEGTWYTTENDIYSTFEAETTEGNPVFAIINTDILNWDHKASHPWILIVQVKYDGKSNNGLPDKETYDLLDKIEDNILLDLKDSDGFLNIGRETAENVREIYFACKDFRRPSKVLFELKKHYMKVLEIDYDIYKDKYWRTFERYTRVS